MDYLTIFALVAQGKERGAADAEAAGSNPAEGTKTPHTLWGGFCVYQGFVVRDDAALGSSGIDSSVH